ncbi:MAG: UDP-N-acetylmuramate--L-alanine ligase [Prolixibacteraceae bacterium]|nr:UDP-N-acetylmuramate--L-alanine ligase [Prolixibacteraceae bacterium]
MIDFNNIQNIYFLGVGGIGMSALARYASFQGKTVAGYDLTETQLTRQLESEGITIHYKEDINQLPGHFTRDNTLVVRTPAVPASHSELRYFAGKGYQIIKRSELLGFLTLGKKCIAVAGTHGKTSVSVMTTLLLKQSGINAGAFLGGISRNFNSNMVLDDSPDSIIVVEADEFDRSFLQLHPTMAVITSADADHLDIYGKHEKMLEAYNQFASQVSENGIVLFKKEIMGLNPQPGRKCYTYSIKEAADFYARHIRIFDGAYHFDFIAPGMIISNVCMEYPGRVNVENMVAAMALALMAGADPVLLKKSVREYKGVERRFDIRFKNNNLVFIDDYAHHPNELKPTIMSVKELYPGKKVLGVFQPHLYTRTRDFADGFAESLDLLDEIILLDIYPAREVPIPGINSEMILKKMINNNKSLCPLDNALNEIKKREFDVLLTMGAGNIDSLAEPLCEYFSKQKF